MPRLLLLSFLLVAGFFTEASAAVVEPPPVKTEIETPTRADLEAKLGRKLTFRERIAIKVLARQQKRQARKARRANGEPGNGWAIAGFVLGILSLIGLSVLAGIPAIIFSSIGIRKARREGLPHEGLAKAGLICGIVSVVLLLLLVVLLSLIFAAGA